jgi:hypothetical protein
MESARLERAIYTGAVKKPPSVWELAGIEKPPVDPGYYKADKADIEKMKANRKKALNGSRN